ncbi:MAG: filamentous hemagglutinin N-terminal domain-containing protein, partial [Alphaproteobacteria bacterium]
TIPMRRQLLTASALGCVAALTPSEGLANPEDGVVAAGSATIVNAPARVDIHQHSERAVIDWRSFDIAPNETTQFHQPSSSSFALNRVKSNTPSSIAGALIANGNVAVVNPNGVLIQQGAKVDVNSLVVSSADTRNEDFMAGGPLKLDIAGKPDAAVINQGTITAKEAGLVGLVAPHVENSGVIEARLGKVALASGDTAVVDLAGDGLISLAVSDSVAKQLVRNSGAVSADGGTVLITAAAGRELVDSLVAVEGTVRAQTVAEKNGAIIIASAAKGHDATQATVKVAAKLDASGKGAGEKGGAVHVQGERILVAEGTRIDASGDAGGGEVLIGGDYLGGNYRGTLATPDLAADDTAWGNTPGGYSSINGTGLAEYLRRFYDYFRPEGGMPTASRTHVGSDVVVDASARTSGHGGRVIYWSDHGTSYSGHTDVGAYGASGHGGFIEVSGRDWLGYNGSFNALATGGRAGTLLLDPTDMTISNAMSSDVTGSSPFDGFGPSPSNLNVTTLQTALGTGNVTVQSSGGTGGNGDITFVDAVAWNNANSLTVNASRHLTVNNTITNAGTGNITLNANISATGDLTINNNITTGGSITGLAGRDLTLAAGRTLTTGAAGGLSLRAA